MPLKFNTFVRKPFTVEAVEVTEKNLKEIAKMIGEVQRGPNGVRYIQVDSEKVRNVTKVEVGYWITRMGRNIRAYSANAFNKEFVHGTPTVLDLAKEISRERAVTHG